MLNHFKYLFNNVFVLQDNSPKEDVIPQLVTVQANSLLTMLPSEKEIHNASFNLRKDNVIDPYERCRR